jgi:hypothetical protein
MEQTLGVLIGVGMALVAARYALHLRRAQHTLETPPADETPEAATERETEARQLRRRWQTSLMLAILGAALAVGVWIPHEKYRLLYVGFWLATALLLCWIGLLAVGDLLLVFLRRARLNNRLKAEKAILDRQHREARLAASIRAATLGERDDGGRKTFPPDEFDSSGGTERTRRSGDDRPDPSLN